jgi:uncharacterized protein
MAEAKDLRVIVFAKAPISGQVKTRLCPPLSWDDAVELHRRMIRHTLNTASIADLGAVELHCAPDTQHGFFSDCRRDFDIRLTAQVAGDLGVKMQTALGDGGRAILVGTDCPSITAEYLGEAVSALAINNSIVFGPAQDGGYGLVGLNGATPDIFSGIPWGGPAVMKSTRNILSAMGLAWRELEPIWDVDRPEDLERLARDAKLKYLLTGLTPAPIAG